MYRLVFIPAGNEQAGVPAHILGSIGKHLSIGFLHGTFASKASGKSC